MCLQSPRSPNAISQHRTMKCKFRDQFYNSKMKMSLWVPPFASSHLCTALFNVRLTWRSSHFLFTAQLDLKGRASPVLPAVDGYCPASPRACALSRVALPYQQGKLKRETEKVNWIFLWSHGSLLMSPVCPDAAAEQPVSADTPGVTLGPPGPQYDDHGLQLAGGREQHSGGIYLCQSFVLSDWTCFLPCLLFVALQSTIYMNIFHLQ